MEVFDRALLRARRMRAARQFHDHDFLYQDVGARLIDRLSLVRRAFPHMLALDGAYGSYGQALEKRAGTRQLITTSTIESVPADFICDAECLPCAHASLDAVVSNLSLHWVNDLPGALLQIRKALKPDGVFIAALVGGNSLHELRDSLTQAELKVRGGVSPRVSPTLDMQDLGALLQRAGFALPVVDNDIITVDYASPFKLMHDLRGMGAANATHARSRHNPGKALFMEAARYYVEKYGTKEGRVTATFDVIYAIGWAPAATQQQPLRPGSAKNRLADALAVTETKI